MRPTGPPPAINTGSEVPNILKNFYDIHEIMPPLSFLCHRPEKLFRLLHVITGQYVLKKFYVIASERSKPLIIDV